MSGGGRHIVFKDMEIGAWPNGLTLDHLEKRIVWTDARYAVQVSHALAPFLTFNTRVTSYTATDSPSALKFNFSFPFPQWVFNNEGHVIFRDLCTMAIFGFKWVLNNLIVPSVDWWGTL